MGNLKKKNKKNQRSFKDFKLYCGRYKEVKCKFQEGDLDDQLFIITTKSQKEQKRNTVL